MRDYTALSTPQLTAMLRQFRRSDLNLTCELGHPACGCSNVASMDGNAPCSEKVQTELAARKAAK